jgi:pimeloyl-ACP methyl ester carboxylesterase
VPQRQITVAGRELTVYDEGDPAGPAILVHHGTPGAGPPYSAWVEDAAARGARLVCFDRPGYGNSTAADGRTVADVVAVCSIAGVAPFDAPGLNYFQGMGEANIIEFGLAMAGREHVAAFVAAEASEMLEHLDELAQTVQSLVTEPDRRALAGPMGKWWADSLVVSFASGVGGWVDDDLAFVRPFGFKLAAIAVPALITQGRQDRFVPIEHGQWLSRAVPGTESWLFADEGHLSLVADRVGEVHEWLLRRLAAAP